MTRIRGDGADFSAAWVEYHRAGLRDVIDVLAGLPGTAAVVALAHDAVSGQSELLYRAVQERAAGDLATEVLLEMAAGKGLALGKFGFAEFDCADACPFAQCLVVRPDARCAQDAAGLAGVLVSVPGAADSHYLFMLCQRDESLPGGVSVRSRLLAGICQSLCRSLSIDHDLFHISRAKNEWESVMDALPQLVCLLDGGGRVLRANRLVEEWGLGSVQSCRGRDLHALLHPGCRSVVCELAALIDQLRSDLLREDTASGELVDSLLQGAFRLRMGWASTQVGEEEDGRPAHSYAILENITEQKRAEQIQRDYHLSLERAVREQTRDLSRLNRRLQAQVEAQERSQIALRESEVRYEGLVENSVTGIYLSDGQKIIYCNRKFAAVFGQSRAGLFEQPLRELFPGPDFIDLMQQVRAQHTVYSEGDVLARDAAGNELITFQSLSTALIGGEILFIGNLADITRQRHMEQELRRLAGQRIRAQEDERARIASELHDGIGQSLSAIKFAMENLLYELPDGTQEHFRQRLQRTIASARASIEEVRRISMDLRPSTLDDLGLIATIGWFCREFGEIFPDLQIEKRIEVAESEVPETLKLDIFRILQESMNNAAKYAGASRLRVSLARRDGELALCIEDNGSGFDVAAVLDSSLTFGLRGMRQRAECSDGGLNISANTDGTRIVVAWRVA